MNITRGLLIFVIFIGIITLIAYYVDDNNDRRKC